MIRIILILVFIPFLFFKQLKAQEQPPFLQCGYDQAIESMERQFPGYKDEVKRSFNNAKHYSSSEFRDEVLDVSVVVHIVYQDETQNISDERIHRLIDKLNTDFRRQNDDANETRAVFSDIVDDAKINFTLESIIKVPTNSIFEFNLFTGAFPDNVKKSELGGSDALNTEEFLNIWVCNIKDAVLLGYSYPPTCAPNWPDGTAAPSAALDGVVVHYDMFNTDTTFTTSGITLNVEGRTLTHEVGHYLGLRHIWGDGNSTIFGIADCIAEDGLEDTPNQGLPSQYSCNHEQNTCTDDFGVDLPDMIENYMDYSSELCMNSFTKDQIQIMRASLLDCRSGVVNMVGVNDQDIDELNYVVSPNPSSGIFNIVIDESIRTENKFYVFNQLGEQILPVVQKIESSIRLDLSNYPNGIYYIKLEENNRTISRKIVLLK